MAPAVTLQERPRGDVEQAGSRAAPAVAFFPFTVSLHRGPHAPPQPGTAIQAEQTLVRRAQAGDHEAYRALYEAYLPRIHGLAFRMCGDADLADDLVQAAFVRVYGSLTSYRGDAPLGAWLHRVALSVILNGLRSERRRRTREVPLEHARASEPAAAGRSELALALERAMDTLSEEARMVVILHDVEGYSHDEIASMMGIRAGASRVRLVRARARLKDALSHHRSGGLR